MKTRPATSALAIVLSLTFAFSTALTGCAQIGSPQDQNPSGDPNDPNNPDNDGPIDPALCTANGDSGEVCEVSGDCNQPLVCLDGVCVGPQNPDIHCDPIEGASCAGVDEVCVGGVCVINPGDCSTSDDCPLGYVCNSGTCTPERDGQACADVGPGPDLSGTWRFTSTLHLRDGLPNVVDNILDVAQDARDIIEGDLDLGLSSIVEGFIGSVVAAIIDNYVPQYAQNLVIALGDMSDILDDMEVDSTVTFTGQPCDGNYRGHEEWNQIRFNFRGQELIVRPDQLPGISEIVPDDFAAWYDCGELYIDRHRIKNSLNGLVRFLIDNIANAVTGAPNVETALQGLVDCRGFAIALDNYLGGVCSFCPNITGIVDATCQTAVNKGISELSEEIDKATVKMSVVSKKGIGTVNPNGDSLANGAWYGSLAGGDFPGEFTAVRQ